MLPANANMSKLYCCNCRKYDHPANSPSCPVYLLLLNRRKGEKKQIQTKKDLQNNNNENGFITIGKRGKPIRSHTPTPPIVQTQSRSRSTKRSFGQMKHPNSQRTQSPPGMPSSSLMAGANHPFARHAKPQTNTHTVAMTQNTQNNSCFEARFKKLESAIYGLTVVIENLTGMPANNLSQ